MNPIEFKHDITSRPLKKLLEVPSDQWNDWYAMGLIAVGLETAAVNLAPAAMLIQAGVPGNRYFSHITYARTAMGFPMPRFNYVTPASAATRWGSKVGSRVGGKAAATIGGRVAGRLVPGLGWGLLAYDVYDIAFNQSLWGFDLN